MSNKSLLSLLEDPEGTEIVKPILMMDINRTPADKPAEPEAVNPEIEAKVLAYLVECGMDPTSFSVKDIDEKSLLFLAGYADNAELEAKENQHAHKEQGGLPDEEKRNDSESAMDVVEGKEPLNTSIDGASEHHLLKENKSIEILRGEKLEADRLELINESMKILALPKRNEESNDEDEIDLDGLEPWQKALFRKLDDQTKTIEECQERIDALAKIVALNAIGGAETSRAPARDYSNDRPPQDNWRNQPLNDIPNPFGTDALPNPPTPLAHGLREPLIGNNAIPNNRNVVLEVILRHPRAAYNYVKTSRPIRIIKAVRREAAEFHLPGNRNQAFIDLHLMFKLAFICVFLRARMGSNRRRGVPQTKMGGTFLGEVLSLWKQHSSSLLVVAAAIVYLIQTGLIIFLYNISIENDVIGRILRNKDLEDEAATEVAVQENVEHHRRRGRRDRVPVLNRRFNINANADDGQIEADDDAGREGDNTNENADQARRFNINVDDTFIGGMVDRPFEDDEGVNQNLPREEIFLGQMIDLMKDTLYLFGSFILSIFPMWRPRQRAAPEPDVQPEAEPEPEQEQENVAN